MPRVDLVISNPGHHVASLLPVISVLERQRRFRFRVLSLCPLRGMKSPVEAFAERDIPIVELFPRHLRSSPTSGRQAASGKVSVLRRAARWTAWKAFVEPPIGRAIRQRPDLVVVPNDSAFPYDRICRFLRRRDIPFLLLQEGIRFPAPRSAVGNGPAQGGGGAAAIAVWGETSARYFVGNGVSERRIVATGSPRFDVITATDWQPAAAALAAELKLPPKRLLFLSNPIDDLGFCDHETKLELVRSFAERIAPLFEDPDLCLLVKLHGRESPDDFRRVCRSLPFADRVRILQEEPLYPLFRLADAAVTFGSSAGLEALLFRLPLAVLEVPGSGYLHDFVSAGAASALPTEGDIVNTVRRLLNASKETSAIDRYLAESLATRSDAARRVAELIDSLVAKGPGRGEA